jgi:hypothetical protein
VLTSSFSCVHRKNPTVSFVNDLHAQSTLPEYLAVSYCQISYRVLWVHRAENTTSTSQESYLATATVEPFLEYYNIIELLA